MSEKVVMVGLVPTIHIFSCSPLASAPPKRSRASGALLIGGGIWLAPARRS